MVTSPDHRILRGSLKSRQRSSCQRTRVPQACELSRRVCKTPDYTGTTLWPSCGVIVSYRISQLFSFGSQSSSSTSPECCKLDTTEVANRRMPVPSPVSALTRPTLDDSRALSPRACCMCARRNMKEEARPEMHKFAREPKTFCPGLVAGPPVPCHALAHHEGPAQISQLGEIQSLALAFAITVIGNPRLISLALATASTIDLDSFLCTGRASAKGYQSYQESQVGYTAHLEL